MWIVRLEREYERLDLLPSWGHDGLLSEAGIHSSSRGLRLVKLCSD